MDKIIKYNVNVSVNTRNEDLDVTIKIFNRKLAKVIIKEENSQV